MTVYIIIFLILSGIINNARCNTHPPAGIYSELLRLANNQGGPTKESAGLSNQNELRSGLNHREGPSHYSPAPPKPDPFYGYHGFGRTPDQNPKAPPISYGGPKSNQYTQPMYDGSSRLPSSVKPGKYGRFPYRSTRPSFMATGSHYTHNQEPDKPLSTDDDRHLTKFIDPHNRYVSQPTPPDQRLTSPSLLESPRDRDSVSGYESASDTDSGLDYAADYQPNQIPGNEPEHPSDEQVAPPEQTNNHKTNMDNFDEFYSPFSKQLPPKSYEAKLQRLGSDKFGILPLGSRIGVNNDTDDDSFFPQLEFYTTTNLGNMTDLGNQEYLSTTTSAVHLGPISEETSINSNETDSGYVGITTTTFSYEWPIEVSTSVSIDVQPIRTVDKNNVPSEGQESNIVYYDYGNENDNKFNYSDYYDDVFPDSKGYKEEFDEGNHVHETSKEIFNSTMQDGEWPDYANGVLYVDDHPVNVTNNVTAEEGDGDLMQNNFNATSIAANDGEKHPALILAVVIGVSVILIFIIVIAIVIVNHLRRKIEEPKLLNFMHNNYCNLAETSFTTGFTNRAYEELDDQSAIARSMENLAAKRLASDTRTKLVGNHPAQMYGNFQNGGTMSGYPNGGSAFLPNDISAHGYVPDDLDLNLTAAAEPIDKHDEM